MGCQEAVLSHEPRRLAILGDAAGDGSQIRGFLAVAGKEDPPAAVRHAHDVVVAGVDVEALTGESARSNVEDRGQALAGYDVKDFLHQDEALSGGEVSDPATGQGKTLGRRGGGMLRFGLDELQLGAPQVWRAVGHGDLVDRRHRGRRRDRVGACAVADPRLHIGDGFGAVDDCRDAWKLRCRGIRHDRRFTQGAQLAGQRTSIQVLEQGAADPAGDCLPLLFGVPVRGQHGDPLRGDEIAKRRHHRRPTSRYVSIKQHHVRPHRQRFTRSRVGRRRLGDDHEAVA